MLSQSFSAENFRRILDLENRKGIYLEGRYFPDLKKISEQIKQYSIRLRENKELTKDESNKIYCERIKLKEQKEKELTAKLEEVSQKALMTDFKVEIIANKNKDGKFIYVIRDKPEQYFIMKQLQMNVSKLFGVKQSSRNTIIDQLLKIIGDKFPKQVLRTDISNFYESIPRDRLINQINENDLLTPTSKKIVRQIFSEYKKLSGSEKGIPRGIGVSAYFAEIYMSQIDKEINKLPNLAYYSRYVDDIVIIFTPSSMGDKTDYIAQVKDIIEQKYELKINIDKTTIFNLLDKKQSCEFDYLGYRIEFKDGQVKTKLTKQKYMKYIKKINVSFDHYNNLSRINEKEARKILVKRVRYLTGNTRLKGNKQNILVGIYYSNCHLTDKIDLQHLDNYLRTKIINEIHTSQLKARLLKYSFSEGFETKRYSPFESYELKKIIEMW
ncbi:MAG: antiviral reverse transcriptase Drt3a [candidate division FCPU426 bacterium]